MTFGIKGMLKMYEDGEETGEYSEEDYLKLRSYIKQMGLEALDVVTQRVSEKEFAITMNTVSGAILAKMWSDHCLLPLFASAHTDEMTAYAHSLCLTILGIAMDEELL